MSDATLRTFVALLLPDGVRTGLAAVSEELRAQTRGLAWVPPENLHLTLRFLGEVGPATLEHVRDAVAAAAAAVAPFTVSLGGLGRLSRRARASGAVGQRRDRRREGRGALRGARGGAGRPRDPGGEPGLPCPRHARPGAGPAGGEELLRVLGAGPAFGEVRVETLHLMRSELGPRGARYSDLDGGAARRSIGAGLMRCHNMWCTHLLLTCPAGLSRMTPTWSVIRGQARRPGSRAETNGGT